MKPTYLIIAVLALGCAGLGAALISTMGANARLQGELATYTTSGHSPTTGQLSPVKAQPPPPATKPTAKLPDDVAAARIDALKSEIESLKIQLSSKDKAIERLQQTVQNQTSTAGPPAISSDWMTRLKSTHPDRYQRLVSAQQKHTEGVYARTTEQAAFIANLDPSVLPADQQEKLLQLQEGLRHLDEVMNPPADGQPADPAAMRRAYYIAVNELRPLMGSAREAALYDFAQQLGYNGPGATDFVKSLKQIYDVTSSLGASPARAAAPN